MFIDTLLTFLSKKTNTDLHYFVKGSFWLTLAQGVIILGGLATTVIFAHILSESEYGVYRYLIGVGALLTSFSLTGIGQSIFQASAKKYVGFFAYGMKASFIYSIGITLTSILGSVYYFFNGNTTLAVGCLLIGIFQPIINSYLNIGQYLNGIKEYKSSTLLQTIKTIFVTGICTLSVYLTQNVLVLLFVFLVAQALSNFIGHLYYKPKEIPAVSDEILNRYLGYAKHTSLRNLVANTALRLDTVLIFQQLGAVEVAIYSIANIIPEQIKGSFKNITSLIIPKYAEHDTMESIKKSIPQRSFQFFLILLCLTIIYMAMAPFIYGLLFPKYNQAVLLSQIAALSFPAFVLLIPFNILQAQLNDKKLHLITTQNAILLIILLLSFTYAFGLMGAVIAKVISRYVNLILSYYYFYKETPQ